MRVVDLSFPIGPHFRWTVASERRSTHEAGANFPSTVLTVSSHAYPHADADHSASARALDRDDQPWVPDVVRRFVGWHPMEQL